VKNTLLPFHAVTGRQAIGWRKARYGEHDDQPIWPVLGGAPDEDDAADDQGDDADQDDSSDDDTDDDSKDDDVDWKAKFEAQQRINRQLERKTKADHRKIQKLTTSKPDTKSGDDAPDPEKIREDARAEAKAEALKDRVLDKIEAKASKFVDPEDAAAILLRGRIADDFIDDGEIDTDAIKDALDELAEKKPHLLAQGKRFQGSADGGARSTKPARPKDLGEALTRHYSGK
jgi:hypothetical protein